MSLGKNHQEMLVRTDEEVFVASLKDPDLFAIIFDRYQAAFIRKAKSILHNEDDALDATQEAFVRIYSAARKYRKMEGASFKSWAYKILINQCLTTYNKNKQRSQLSITSANVDLENLKDVGTETNYQDRLTKDYMLSLVSRLPTLLARTVDLHFIRGFPQKEIAALEGISHELVRSRIHRAKKELRKIEGQLSI